MKKDIGELVVRPRSSPRRLLLIAGIAVIGLLVAAGLVYNYGLNTAGMDRFTASRQLQDAQQELKRLKLENQDLRDALARVQLALQTDQTAYQELDRALRGSSQEINKLREELSFYRNIISPTNKQPGLQIQRLDIAKGRGSENQYVYKLTLIQSLKHDRPVGGEVRFEVQGEQDGKNTVLYFPEGDKPILVSFKYFQDVDGVFRLPANFRPTRVKVVISAGAGVGSIEQSYNWPRA